MDLGSMFSGLVSAVSDAPALGLLAGAFLAVGVAANLGLIGGSVGKFMSSGMGRGLLAATALGSAAVAMYGQTPGQANATEAAQPGQAPLGAAGQNLIKTGNPSDAAQTGTAFMDTANMSADVGQMQLQNPDASNATGTTGLAEGNKSLGAGSSQTSANATAATQAAGQPQPSAVPTGGVNPAVKQGYAGLGGVPPEAAATPPATPPPGADEGAYKEPDSAPGEAPSFGSKVGGMLSSAMGTPGMMQGVGSMIGGIGAGIAQKQAMEDQVRAQQWGNMQWQNQGQVASMQSAAAKPITVPQGYLQRAQQVRTLMSGGQGMQPLPTAQPGAPLAPPPTPALGH